MNLFFNVETLINLALNLVYLNLKEPILVRKMVLDISIIYFRFSVIFSVYNRFIFVY